MIMIVNGNKVSPIQTQNQMTGEKIPGDLQAWSYFGTDPNTLLLWSYQTISERATTLFHTHAPVSAAINKTAMYAIGTGLKFRSQPDWKTLGIKKEYAKDWGMRFQALVHYMFVMLNFYQKQGILFRTADIMGDSLLLFDRTEQPDGMPFDLIEAGGDYIDWQKTGSYNNDNVTLGIIHDKFQRRKGIKTTDGESISFTDANNDQNLIQFYNKYMARQLRGYPLAYKIIAAAKNNDRWWDATLQRLVMETIILGTTTNTTSDFGSQVDDLANIAKNEAAGSSAERTVTTSQITNSSQLMPGSIMQLRGKGELNFTDLKTPANNFDKVQSAYMDIVGMATDVPPEVIMSKYSTSFTAHKGALNDFEKSYMLKRGNFMNTVCTVTLREIAKYLIMNEYIEQPAPGFFKDPIVRMATLAGTWLGPVPGHINPSVEVDALIKAKDNAFITPSDAAAQYDREWDNQIEEWQQQMDEWQKFSPEQKAKVMQEQEEELNAADDEEQQAKEKEEQKKQDETKVKNTGEVMSITSPMGNFDFQVRKRTTKKTVNYVDINGKEKQAEIIEEEL